MFLLGLEGCFGFSVLRGETFLLSLGFRSESLSLLGGLLGESLAFSADRGFTGGAGSLGFPG